MSELRIFALPMRVEEVELEGETCFVVVDDEGQELGDDNGTVYYLQRHVAEASAEACAVMRQEAVCSCGWRGLYDDSRNGCPVCLSGATHGTDTWVVLDCDDWGAGEPEWTDGRVDDIDDDLDDYASLVDEDDWEWTADWNELDDSAGIIPRWLSSGEILKDTGLSLERLMAERDHWREIATTIACALTLVEDTLPASVRTRADELLREVRGG